MPRTKGSTEQEVSKFDDFVWKHRNKHPQMIADMYGKCRTSVYYAYKRLEKQGKIVNRLKK